MSISVALCTYNGEKFLRQQLDSILEQSLPVDEIIICDDLSKDSTVEILHEYQNKNPKIIKLVLNINSLGTIKNFEKAIGLTKGNLIFLADQDDVWHKDKVEIMDVFFKKNKNCKLLFSNGSLIDENGISLNSTLWEKWDFNEDLRTLWLNNAYAFKSLIINNNKITGATVCFHNSLKKNSIPITLPYGYWHDGWLGLHAAASEGLMFIEKSLIDYRIHNEQQVGVSSIINKEIINNSNLNPTNKFLFYKKISAIYPNLKIYIPKQESQNKFLKKVKKFYLKLCKKK